MGVSDLSTTFRPYPLKPERHAVLASTMTPAAGAMTGDPSGAAMSTPWCIRPARIPKALDGVLCPGSGQTIAGAAAGPGDGFGGGAGDGFGGGAGDGFGVGLVVALVVALVAARAPDLPRPHSIISPIASQVA